MEPFQKPEYMPARDKRPHFDVLVEAGRKGRRKTEVASATVLPAAESDRSLGDDVDRIGLKSIHNAGNLRPGINGQMDLRIGGTRNGRKVTGMNGEHAVAHLAQVVNRLGQGRDNTAYLWMPGIGGESDSHGQRQCDGPSGAWLHCLGRT
jgi:hypothetical protein